jgi:hypothetical protein
MKPSYANTIRYRPVKPTTAPGVNIGLRVPLELARAMDEFCRRRRVKRTDLVVAALYAHLGVARPEDAAG